MAKPHTGSPEAGNEWAAEYYEASLFSAQSLSRIHFGNYYPFGLEIPNPNNVNNGYRYGFNGKENDPDWGGDLIQDYGFRMYNPRIGKFLSVDPDAKIYPDYTPYHYVRNNPVLRLDPNGKWDITVHAYKERDKFGYGIAIVKDRKGKEVYRFKVRLEGTGGRDRTVTNSDTPLGVYDIPDNNSWLSGGDRKAYGPNHRLILTPLSGEILDSGRDNIRIHGGRQEEYDKQTGKWVSVKNPILKKTHGCLRCFDDNVKTLKEITDQLEKDDSQEFGGTLEIKTDLIKEDGKYFTPDDYDYLKREESLLLQVEGMNQGFEEWRINVEIDKQKKNVDKAKESGIK